MSDISDLALGAAVAYLAPVSLPLAPSSDASSRVLSSDRIQLPIVLDFYSEEGKRAIKGWYKQQPTTRFTSIEYRKDAGGRFGHEFIVVQLDNSALCRFDRRAREDKRGHALEGEGTISEDTAHIITWVDTESQTRLDESEVILKIDFREKQDLEFILALCYGIQSHPRAKSYSLLYYNCYFFSWALVTAIARRASWWENGMSVTSLWATLMANIEWGESRPSLKNSSHGDKIHTPRKRLLGFHSWWSALARRLRLSHTDTYSNLSSPFPSKETCRLVNAKLLDYALEIPPDFVETLLFRATHPLWSIPQGETDFEEYTSTRFERLYYEIKAVPGFSLNSFREESSYHKDRGSNVTQRTFIEFIDSVIDSTAWNINRLLLEHLPDPIFTRPAPKSKVRNNLNSLHTHVKGEVAINDQDPSSFSLQDYIKGRMMAHFERVEKYGFGEAATLIERAEASMSEIWISTIHFMGHGSREFF